MADNNNANERPQSPAPFFVNQHLLVKGKSERVQVVSLDDGKAKVAYNKNGEVAHKILSFDALQNNHPHHITRDSGDVVFLIRIEKGYDDKGNLDSDKDLAHVVYQETDDAGNFIGWRKRKMLKSNLKGVS